MQEYRSSIVFLSVAAYMAMCIGVGLWAMRRTKSTRDFQQEYILLPHPVSNGLK